MKPTARNISCPRCGARIGRAAQGAYRSNLAAKHWCEGCAVFVCAEAKLIPLQLALAQSHRLRRVEAECPGCGERLTRWLVTYAERMLELEACRDCGVVVLDSDELDPAASLLAEALPDLFGP